MWTTSCGSVLEEFRIPPSFDPATVRVFNTNVFHFDARAIQDLNISLDQHVLHREEEGGRSVGVVQFERLVNEVTSYLPTAYLHMPRDGAASRFLPVKDNDELALRVPEILAVTRARGILP